MIASGVLVLGVAILAALSPSAAATRGVDSGPSIVCPELAPPPCCSPIVAVPIGAVGPSAVRANAVSCCPVATVAGCCGPATPTSCCAAVPCPAGLSIAASPNPAGEGAGTTISGVLSGGTVASQTVDLYERPAGEAAFTDVGHTQTSASGAYQFERAVQTNTEWYAKAGSVQSATMSEAVLAAVSLHPSSTRPKAGAQFMLSGTIAPSHAGERVALQRLQAEEWVTIAQPKLSAESRFAIAERPRGHTSARFRVVLAADARNARSVSSLVSITAR